MGTTLLRSFLVLGMHRSGTSVVAGMLGDLGCRLPSDLMEATPMNPKGFCESTSITALDDELMASLGSSWFDWRPLQIDPASTVCQALSPRAVDATINAFGNSDYAVLKDPRISRLVPFWEEVLGETGREVRCVHVYRDPREVIASLDMWAGYDPGYGELLWLRYLLDAEFSTRHLPRAFVSYARVLEDWPATAEQVGEALGVKWPTPPREAGQNSAAFVDPKLRRSVPMDLTTMSQWTQEAMAVFDGWAARGEDQSQRAVLDLLRSRLDDASPGFASVVDLGRKADVHVRELAEALKSLEADAHDGEATSAELAESRMALERATGELAALRDLHDKVCRELAEVRGKHERDRRYLAQVEASLEQRDEELTQSHAEYELAQNQLSELSTQVETLSVIVSENRVALAGSELALAEERSENERLHADLAAMTCQRDRLRRLASRQMRDRITKILSTGRTDADAAPAQVDLEQLQVADEQLRLRIRELERVHQAMLASRSWRITAPLRRFSKVVRRNEASR